MPRRCLSLLALALLVAVPAAGALVPHAEPLRLALTADRTVAIPLGAPVPVASTGIGPGTPLVSTIGGTAYACTAGWVFTDGAALYLGAAGHCFLPETKISTHGRGANFDARHIPVRACIEGCSFGGQSGFILSGSTVALGPVVYARQIRDGVQIGNDFGLVRIPPEHAALVRTALPVWGGAVREDDVSAGEIACHYGNGVGVGETFATKARTGAGLFTYPDGSWRVAGTSGPGDSGAAMAICDADASGTRAVGAAGILTHLAGGSVAGTTMGKARALAAEAGLAVWPVLAG